MTQLSIVANKLEKSYELANDDVVKKAVDGVSFTLQEGERIGFIGANGAGKTTLLQLLAGISTPTAGSLSISGRVTAIFTIGMGLRDDLSGLENIYVEGELLGRSRADTAKVIDEIVAFAELGQFIDRPVRTYSTGMKARLAFSTIVHIEPEILIIDEALSVGDAKFSEKATRKMRELTRRGKILIVVSHSMAAVNEMCTRCIWMENGKVRQDGSPRQVTGAYLDQVRSTNEAVLFDRFRRQILNESMFREWSLHRLDMCKSSDDLPITTGMTGDPLTLRTVVLGQVGAAFDLRFQIKRLDGLLVRSSKASSDNCRPAISLDGSKALQVDLGHNVLNQGIYLITLEVLLSEGIAARRSTLVEIVNPHPHKGGRPVLVYPSSLKASRIAP